MSAWATFDVAWTGLLVGIGTVVTAILFIGMGVLGILSLASLGSARLGWAWFYCWRQYAAFAAANVVTLFPGMRDEPGYLAVIAAPWVFFFWLFVRLGWDRALGGDIDPRGVNGGSDEKRLTPAWRERGFVGLIGMAAYAVSFIAGRAAVGVAVEFLNSPEEEREFRASFEEESDGWDSWSAIWADSTTGTMAGWGARVAVFHLTEDETIGLYRYRSSLLGRMAADSTAGALCFLGAFADEESLESIDRAGAGSIIRPLGRAFGRHHEGGQPWVPPVDLATDEAAWTAFAEYLDGIGRGQLFDDMLNIGDAIQPDPTRDCQVQSELYGLAAERAQDGVGAVRLIDFVRSMDALGARPLLGTVHATELDHSADPEFGTVALQSGFTPSPNVSEIVSFGGVVDTSYLGGDCVGYAAAAPDIRLMWSGTSNELRILFTEGAGEDATLVMNLPDASWVCNDDYAGALDPLIALENPPEGQYDIWIGSYQPNQFISGTLSVTER